MNFASWRTTLCGAVAALGTFLVGQGEPWHTIGVVVAAVATLGLGFVARDNVVTSESAGAKK